MNFKPIVSALALLLGTASSSYGASIILTFSDGTTGECPLKTASISLGGTGLSASCAIASADFLSNPPNNDPNNPPNNDPKNPPNNDPKNPPNNDPTDTAWAQLADGTSITLDQELSGDIQETVYWPSVETPQMIIYEGYKGEEIQYPGCAGVSKDHLMSCQGRGSLSPDVVIAQRIRDDHIRYAEFYTRMTGDRLYSYDVMVAPDPDPTYLDGNPSNCLLKEKARGSILTDPQSRNPYACNVVREGNNLYVIFRPNQQAGGDRCGTEPGETTCRLTIWVN